MLSVNQPVIGAIEEVLTTLLNSHIIRTRNSHQRKNNNNNSFNKDINKPQEASIELDSNPTVINSKANPVLQEICSFLANTNNIKVEDVLVSTTNNKRQGFSLNLNGKLLQISPNNSKIGDNRRFITLQRRGFRTRNYQSREEDEKIRIGAKDQSSILNLLGVTSRMKAAFQKSVKKDSIKALLENSELKGPEKIKVAFAEGYFAAQNQSSKGSWLSYGLVFLALGGLAYTFLGNFVQFRIGSSAITQVTPEEVTVSFNDVKGIEEAKEEVMKIVDYLKDPMKYTRLGARLPKGVLLVGLPGSGKTLLAKAIAGEAQVPFFRTSGSEFEEMLVGLGAKRVRDLFATARGRAPCVIFIDEIDSIGSKRSYSAFHPYANQTINQLLTEMDGFLSSSGIIVLGATNRREDLDPALLRPGRFDVEVVVPWPDLKGRMEIFSLYLDKVKKDSDIDVEKLAKATVGLSGADIENMVNQAALQAAADNRETVNMHYLDMAHDLIQMGPAKKSLPSDKDVNANTAYHEAGHALVAFFTKDATPLHRVTIIPRGQSLGHTAFRHDKEIYGKTKSQLSADLDVAMGGRAAEELIFGSDKVGTGVMSDLQGATKVAENMVKKFGMSDKTGFRFFETESRSIIPFSDTTAELLDSEIKRLLQEAYDRAKNILKAHAPAHKRLADALLEYETLNAEEIKLVIEGQPLKKNLKLV